MKAYCIAEIQSDTLEFRSFAKMQKASAKENT